VAAVFAFRRQLLTNEMLHKILGNDFPSRGDGLHSERAQHGFHRNGYLKKPGEFNV
jgi:hypothetical protein